VSLEPAFETLLGRQPTDAERARLHRIRDALHLGDNDALWLVILALEHYDGLFRTYPDRLAEATRTALEHARVHFAAAAEAEFARAERRLAERVAATSVALARTLAAPASPVPRIATTLALLIAFGALCTSAGAVLATSPPPFWVTAGPPQRIPLRILVAMLGAPAGWMAFAVLLPLGAHLAREGWRTARDPEARGRERLLAAALVVLAVGSAVGCAAGLWILF
jgi:hypothetical protein